MAKVGQEILTTKTLAQELDISIDEAKALMLRDDFPATETAPGKYAVERDLLVRWIHRHHRGYEPPRDISDLLSEFNT